MNNSPCLKSHLRAHRLAPSATKPVHVLRCAVISCVALALSFAVFFSSSRAHAQACQGTITEGCTNPGAVCKPVTKGTGTTGHCQTGGLPGLGKFNCACAGTPVTSGWVFDPGCSDRTAQGNFTCTITQPVVNAHETDYPKVEFAPGDLVSVTANGCVQTGGSGSTWKRYANPSGPNTGPPSYMYEGRVLIPTTKEASALVPIHQVIGRTLLVTGTGLPESQLFLHLGYQDDGYSDNGYYSHDDGTDDQCKADGSNAVNGGPAYVVVTIARGVPLNAPPSRFDFDVSSGLVDSNGLPLNPSWSWQQRAGNQGKMPDTSTCHNFSKRGSTLGIPDLLLSPDFGDCTDQAVNPGSVDMPIESNADICDAGEIYYGWKSFAGHVDWFPITVEGSIGFGGHNTDDDYDSTFTSDTSGNPLSVNGRNGLHVEFDSDETIDHFNSDAWNTLHNAVDNNGNPDQYFNGHTILTGMFGLDGEHGLKAELHPVYALATRQDGVSTSPSDEPWLMFIRNQGDEGFCSSNIWDSGFEDYTFHLPWRSGMTSVAVNWDKTQFDLTDGASGPTLAMVRPPAKDAGVYVTFHLGAPVPESGVFSPGASVPFVNGALHLIWSGNPILSGTIATTATTATTSVGKPNLVKTLPGGLVKAQSPVGEIATENDEVEDMMRAALNKLTPAERNNVLKARNIAVTHPATTHRSTPTGPILELKAAPVREKKIVVARRAIKAGPATRKAQRDAAQIKALCAATHNAPSGLPATVCKPTTPAAPVHQ
jgi:hypothetical protein